MVLVRVIGRTVLLALFTSCCCTVAAQDGFMQRWFRRSDQAKASEPQWMTPLVTVTPRLEQEFRTDFLVQHTPGGANLANLGNAKGLEVIPNERLQVTIGIPPYLQHNQPNVHDGFGDLSFLVKYRLAARNESSGNYAVTAFLGASVPTGSYNNGARSAVITPTIAAGKGWGRFDIQSNLSAGLPTAKTDVTGHAIAFNTAFQYRVAAKVWPEFEVNSVFWKGGTQDGKKQTVLTAGLILGRFKLHGRVLLSIGAGYQVAASHYHAYNRAAVITVRFPF
jgi:hypothetical protein